MKYTVGSLAKLFGVSSNTIRRYADMGYITPETDKNNNYSYYNAFDVNKIVGVRMYRKFGFSHDEIKKIFESDVNNVVESFQSRLAVMDEEIERLKSLRSMFNANMIMIKRIDEYESGFIEQEVEATYYVEYQKDNRLLKERERLKSIQKFMYSLPQTKEVLIFKRNDIINEIYSCSFGFAAKKKDINKFNVEINDFMKFMPVQKCIYFPLKTYYGNSRFEEINEEIKKEKFRAAMEYLEKCNLILNNNVLGFNITSFMENGQEFIYTLICLPVAEKV